MAAVDVSNPDLLREVDPIKKAVYDEEAPPKFNIGHLHAPTPPDLFGWADKERGKKSSYEMDDQTQDDGKEQWELDVKPLISSKKWLQVHGLQRNRLSMKQILSQIGFKHNEDYIDSVKKPVGSYYGNGLFQQFRRKDGQLYNITVGREKLRQIEESLMRASHIFKRRLQWLTTESRRIFGVVQEHCVCFILDVSTMSQTQFDLYRESLCMVIRDQVSQLAKFNMIKAQADMQVWQEQAVPVTELTIKSAIEWVQGLDRMAEGSRTATTEAIVRAMEDDSLEAVYLFAEGDSCESSKELIRQKLTEAPHPLHTVSFNAGKSSTIKFLKEIAMLTSGRFHAFVVKSIYEEDSEALPSNAAPPGGDASRISVRLTAKPKGGIPAGAGVREDVFDVWLELEECRNNFVQVQSLLNEIPDHKTDSAAIDRPKPPSSARQEHYMGSRQWLERHGLRAKGVSAFQALASCSFRHVDGVVDLKGKPTPCAESSDAQNVRKLVNAKYCDQFAHTKWKDGTVVHVHITAEKHRTFEKKMKTTLDAIQRRIDWLQQGSREVFGTILEEQVYILIDTSQSMKEKLPMLKEKVFQLMQEQLRHKSKFNFVTFDTKAVAWKDRAVDVTEQNLLNAWNWIKDIGVGGSTNTLAALRIALADPYTHAIYLLTDGRPDQNPRSVLAQVQLQHPVPIHTIAFNCNDLEANKFLFQISQDTGGRYHNFSSTGGFPESPPPFESEDVSLLKKELEQGKRDLEKISKLRAQCVMLDWYHNKQLKSGRKTPAIEQPPRPRSENSRRRDSGSGRSTPPPRPHTSQGHYTHPSPPKSDYPQLAVAHKNHRGSAGVNDPIILKKRYKRKNQNKVSHRAGHTRTSVLRLAASDHGELNGWMLPETRKFMENQINKSMEAYQDIMRGKMAEKEKKKVKRKKPAVNPLDLPNSVWLKKNGLVARKLTVMDVLTPTVVRVKPKYIPVLDSHVVSKVFNDVLPIAHVSPRNRQEVRLVNPAAVDLPGYDKRLSAAVAEFRERLDLVIWRNLTQEERDKFEDGPVSYTENEDALNQCLDRLGWPITQKEIQVLLDEIYLGERYLQQSRDLQRTAKELAMGRKKKKSESKEESWRRSGSKDESWRRSGSKEERVVRKSEELEERTDSSSVTSDAPENQQPPKKAVTIRKSSGLNPGQKVIARDEVDGYYYEGSIVKCTDARHALVSYNHDGEEVVPARFILPVTGAVSCPPLKVGDYVLAYSETESNVPCYVPGMVIGTPRRTQVRDKFFTILKYNNMKSALLRKRLYKISESQYKFARRYAENAQQIDNSVPSVDFIPQPPLRAPPSVSSDTSSSEEESDDSLPSKPKVVDVVLPSSSASSVTSVTSQLDSRSPPMEDNRHQKKGRSSSRGSRKGHESSSSRSSSLASSSRKRSSDSRRRRDHQHPDRAKSDSRVRPYSGHPHTKGQRKSDRKQKSHQKSSSESSTSSSLSEDNRAPLSKSSSRRRRGNRVRSSSSDDQRTSSDESRRLEVDKEDVNAIKRNLGDLQAKLEETMTEQQKQREVLKQQAEDLESARKHFEEMMTQPPPKKVTETSVNTEHEPLSEVERSISSHSSSSSSSSDEESTPRAQSPKSGYKTPDQYPVPKARSPPKFINKGQAAVRELSPQVLVDEEVLHRCLDDGWYYRGTVVKVNSDDGSYDISDNTNGIQKTFREDIITDTDDASNTLQENDSVVALHPEYPNSYAPGVIAGVLPDSWFNVKFYDNSVSNVARDEIYKIHASKMASDVSDITKKEKRWVGEAVVTRSDQDGRYHLASCTRRVGNGHQFAIQWADGSSGVQNLSCMFGAFSKQRKMNIGDYVIAMADRENLTYLPGRVAASSGTSMTVVFCNRARTSSINAAQAFWISKEYHDLAVAFYRSKQTVNF